MGHLLPDARDCRVSWAWRVADVARWDAYIERESMRLLPDVCGCPVSWIASDVLGGDALCLPSLSHHLFFHTFEVERR